MSNLLMPEYVVRAAEIGAKHGADADPSVKNGCLRWTDRLAGLSVSMELAADPRQPGALSPEVRIGMSSGLQSDPLTALAQLESARATLMRALSAAAEVRRVLVWIDEAPCDWCHGDSARGKRPCDKCGNKGIRTVVGER